MKASLPSSAKVSKEAKESIQECVSEFISFIVISYIRSVVAPTDIATVQ